MRGDTPGAITPIPASGLRAIDAASRTSATGEDDSKPFVLVDDAVAEGAQTVPGKPAARAVSASASAIRRKWVSRIGVGIAALAVVMTAIQIERRYFLRAPSSPNVGIEPSSLNPTSTFAPSTPLAAPPNQTANGASSVTNLGPPLPPAPSSTLAAPDPRRLSGSPTSIAPAVSAKHAPRVAPRPQPTPRRLYTRE